MSTKTQPKKRKAGVFREALVDDNDAESKRTKSLKNRIRSYERLLAKPVRVVVVVWLGCWRFDWCMGHPQDLPVQARKDKTRLLKKMQQELKARKDEEKWEKMALRYKKVTGPSCYPADDVVLTPRCAGR